jgi:hypothetical protein
MVYKVMEEKIPSLSDLMKMIAEEKQKQQPKYTVDKLDLNLNETINNMFAELTGKPIEEKVIEQEIVVEHPQSIIVENNLGLLGGDANTKTEDPLTPLDQNFVTHEDLSKHYKTFIQRVQQQLSTIGGGGETKFLRLDDVNAKSKNDNWLLEYDEQSKTVKFTNQLGPVDRINFDLTHVHDEEGIVGTLCWSPEDQTLNIEHPGGVTQQVGQELYGYVRNQTGSTILNGAAVRFDGAEQNGTARLLVAPYLANDEFDTLLTFGIATQDIANGEDGRVTVWGKVRELDTSAFNVGDILYVSPTVPGGLTNIKPTAPNNVVPIAAVLRKDSSEGEIFVRPTIEQERKYGNFYSDSNQTAALTDTPYAIRAPIRSFGKGFTLDSDEASLIASTSGLYNFNVNLQLISTNSSAKDVWFWLRQNDSDIPKTTRKLTISGNNVATVFSVVHNVSMSAGDKVKHMWATSNTTLRLDAPAPTAFAPSTPSVIIDITQAAL